MLKFKTRVGWTVYKVTDTECYSWGGLSICDDCGKFVSNGFLVPVLNHFMCIDCFNQWRSSSKFYPEDLPFERKNITYYESILPVINLDSCVFNFV